MSTCWRGDLLVELGAAGALKAAEGLALLAGVVRGAARRGQLLSAA